MTKFLRRTNWFHAVTKICKLKFLVACIFFTFVIGCLLAVAPVTVDDCDCRRDKLILHNTPERTLHLREKHSGKFEHKLAVLVPYRDRFEELLVFAPYIVDFLNKQNIDHHIYILNQVDRYRFNRASLINVGFLLSREECDYIVMHDVDLLPLNPQLQYGYPESGPFHVASPDLHPRYHYPTFVGGILIIKREHFEQVNGMSNKYWGWGLEDDEFYVRLKEAGLNVSRPANISTGTENTFRHTHDRLQRKRDMTKCFNQREITRRRDRQTGLKDVVYKVISVSEVVINEAPLTVVNIELSCNKELTPWCDCGGAGVKKTSNSTVTKLNDKNNLKNKHSL